jgi:gliding motility-associated lipoprotein GldH
MKFILFAPITLILFCCDSNRVFEKNYPFQNRSWKASEPVEFEFTVEDTTLFCHVYFTVRNSLEYPYARLFVQYTLRDTAGAILQKKLSTQYLFDQKSGKPLGRSAIGDVFDHQFLLLPNYRFPYPGKYRLTLEQFNRDEDLKGVMAVGVRIEREALK